MRTSSGGSQNGPYNEPQLLVTLKTHISPDTDVLLPSEGLTEEVQEFRTIYRGFLGLILPGVTGGMDGFPVVQFKLQETLNGPSETDELRTVLGVEVRHHLFTSGGGRSLCDRSH